MSEFRQDPLTGAWVIVAPERGARPRTAHRAGSSAPPSARFDPACPFCPGNERMLAGIIEETPADAPPGWGVRVVANKYPALTPGNDPSRGTGFPVASLPGHGHHEVIIETPRHDASPESLDPAALAEVLRICRRRLAALAGQPGIGAVLVFRNRGEHGGASLAHPHSQVIATGLVPPRLAAARAWARERHAEYGRCAACETLAYELTDPRRVVETTERFVTVVPFAAANPFEQRILPRRHQPSFREAGDDELAALAPVLQRALRRLSAALGNPSYNYFIEPGTIDDGPHAHWSLTILPGTTRPGGFELAAGLPINPSLPEKDAETLRSVALRVGDAAEDQPRAPTRRA